MGPSRPASVADIHELAAAMPAAELTAGAKGNPIYAVRRKGVAAQWLAEHPNWPPDG